MTTPIYHYHPATGEFLGTSAADTSSLEPDVPLLPAYTTPAEPPPTVAREAALYLDIDCAVPTQYQAGTWHIVQDWRGMPLWSTVSGEPLAIDEPGVTPTDVGATDQPRPSAAHVWRDGRWDHDVALDEQLLTKDKAAYVATIDERAATIYSRWTRFEAEYRARESAAKAFEDAGHQGDPGLYVTSFAEPAGLTTRAATDAILAQAAALRAAQDALSALRMRKYEVARSTTVEVAQTLAEEIIAAMDEIARGIC